MAVSPYPVRAQAPTVFAGYPRATKLVHAGGPSVPQAIAKHPGRKHPVGIAEHPVREHPGRKRVVKIVLGF
jgi:hypothetical protein